GHGRRVEQPDASRDRGADELPVPAGGRGGLQPPPGAQPDHRYADPAVAQASVLHVRHPCSIRPAQSHDVRRLSTVPRVGHREPRLQSTGDLMTVCRSGLCPAVTAPGCITVYGGTLTRTELINRSHRMSLYS